MEDTLEAEKVAVTGSTTAEQTMWPALVVDTAALLQLDLRLDKLAQELFTIPEVLQEVRSRAARQNLSVMPYDIKERQPTEAACRFGMPLGRHGYQPPQVAEVMKRWHRVVDFSKATGDFPALSVVDLRVLALTYMLETERTDGAHLRKQPTPPKSVVGAGGVTSSISGDARLPEGFVFPVEEREAEHVASGNHATGVVNPNADTQGRSVGLESATPKVETEDEVGHGLLVATVERSVNQLSLSVSSTPPSLLHGAVASSRQEDAIMPVADHERPAALESGARAASAENDGEIPTFDVSDDEGDDSDEGWITPENVKKLRAQRAAAMNETASSRESANKVGCITGDFAMQIGLRVVGVDGKLIRNVRSYVLRCHACFKFGTETKRAKPTRWLDRSTKDMTKKFCPSCGNASLIRTSVSVDADGTMRYHLKSNFQYRLRGTKYSIPDPVGGRKANNLILREDQREFTVRQSRSKKERSATNVFDPDAAWDQPGTSNRKGSDGPTVGYGRRNPNERRPTGGNKKR